VIIPLIAKARIISTSVLIASGSGLSGIELKDNQKKSVTDMAKNENWDLAR
jgi:hypothetical protein